ncbi:antitoxin YefM [Krasilnikovia cinnamomea]|uniref:Antitoxin n=1 Tax=Krasilnikovia cinnamomea TaxID=349313 RepID=A0A4Q7ZFE8_9ACTN|nr:type II toxin-antitoxin system prevent-host-death family antitoxin [Krasilnikovia cinnamomea]RZU49011.1 antitoxin YefM [Krasilnikovia cinnamomea]
MRVISASDLRSNLAAALDAIESDAENLVVTRSGHEDVVIMLKRDYDAWRETDYLSRGANGLELRRRIAEMDAGGGVVHDLIDGDTGPSLA